MTVTNIQHSPDQIVNDYFDGKISFKQLRQLAAKEQNTELQRLVYQIGVRITQEKQVAKWKPETQRKFVEKNKTTTSFKELDINSLHATEVQRIAKQLSVLKVLHTQKPLPKRAAKRAQKIVDGSLTGPYTISPKGLPNMGNTCFANAALQILFTAPGIDALLAAEKRVQDDPEVRLMQAKLAEYQNQSTKGGKTGEDGQAEAARMTTLLPKVEENAQAKIDFRQKLASLKKEWDKKSPNQAVIRGHLETLWSSPILEGLQMRVRQEDAEQFLRVAIEAIGGDFGVPTTSVVTNPQTGHSIRNEENRETLQLPIPKQGETLQSCFDMYLQPEVLEKENRLHQYAEHSEKRLFFTGKAPQSLQFSLKRFTSDNQKIHKPIKGFGGKLIIPFCDGSGTVNRRACYQVDAAVCHRGQTTHSGHYFTLVRAKGGWIEYNDQEERRLSYQKGLQQLELYGYVVQAHLLAR